MGVVRLLVAAFGSLFGILLALPIILIGLPFVAVATLTRSISRLFEPRYTPWGQLIEFDPNFGWKPKANLNTYHLTDDIFHVTTDAQGWRGKTSLTGSHIVAFGDSFTWGYGINDKDFFGDLIPNLQIKPIGTIGYNMVQELLWMRQLSSQLKSKLVVWFIYFGNDLYENLMPDMCGYRTPFVRLVNGTGAWEIVTSHISPTKWPYTSELRTDGRNYYAKLSELCGPSVLSDRAYAAAEYLIHNGRDICNSAGAQLVVITIPDTTQLSPNKIQRLLRYAADPDLFDPHYPDRQISKICRKLGIAYLALKDHLTEHHYKQHDCHWNQKGHRKVAEILSNLYYDWVPVRNRADMN